MRTFAVFVVSSMSLAALTATACTGNGNRTGTEQSSQSAASLSTAEMRMENGDRHVKQTSGNSSPFIVGDWKFIPGTNDVKGDAGTPTPQVDSEFRFINPTDLDVTLEYAFFELDGTFCGCDRDDLPPNKTTVYTILGESLSPAPVPTETIPTLFSCHGTSGALKAIVFKNKGQRIFLDDATQVGFQTHAFGGIVEFGTSPNFNLLTGAVMTESEMAGVAISDSTLDEVRNIHEQCNTVNGPLSTGD